MKEAAGEANLTVVAIILIGVVVAIVSPLVTSMMSTSGQKACCTDYGGIWKGNKCLDPSNNNEITTTNYWNATNKVCK